MTYNFSAIEKKWQKKWEEEKAFFVKQEGKKKKFYVLEMFPYPSGAGLHMGHALNYTIGDIYARFKRMQGYNVLYPMGYDAFGLPAENAAIKAGEHPKKYTQNSIKNFIKQQKALGLSYDWTKKLVTAEEEYYKWNQLFFLKLYETGLAYRKKSPVNWCPKCQSVLANEQVHNGKCWRHEDTDVEVKHLEQWFIKTTKYSDELLDKIDDLDWPERIKLMQKNWIGKSHGTEIMFEINGEKWPIFTTRPDTIYGVTFMVVSAQHERLNELVTKEQKKDVEKFLKKLKGVSEKQMEDLEKEGVFTGSYAINPLTNEKIPVYAGNFVVADYGAGMVMAVPAHDQRDYEFAKKYGIKIKKVIEPVDFELDFNKEGRAYTGKGTLVNSKEFDGVENEKAKEEITKFLEKKKSGKKVVNYKFRDWLVSRQRYWGTPIPMVYCEKCGAAALAEKDLPIVLPDKVEFGKGNPLATNEKFVNVKCPKCGGKARRETDTMDTFFDSSWYFLRYTDNENPKKPFEEKNVEYWMPVDCYIGGAEHATMHLIYARFFVKALRDMGFIELDEPFKKLFNQGMLHATDGRKMSKSFGNVVNPLDVVEKYGADSLRLALMSFASPDKDTNWDENVLIGSNKFLNKLNDYFGNVKIVNKKDSKVESKLNKIVKEVTNQIEGMKYNLAIIRVRELFDYLPAEIDKETLEKSLKLLSVFCPHVAEEFWSKIKGKGLISLSEWPKYDEKKIDDNLEKMEQALDKLVDDINHVVKILSEKEGKDATKAWIYVLPFEKKFIEESLSEISKRTGVEVKVYSVSDKDKYDPAGKAGKAKPSKPAIYLE